MCIEKFSEVQDLKFPEDIDRILHNERDVFFILRKNVLPHIPNNNILQFHLRGS